MPFVVPCFIPKFNGNAAQILIDDGEIQEGCRTEGLLPRRCLGFTAVEPDVVFMGLYRFDMVFKTPVGHGFIEGIRFKTLNQMESAPGFDLVGLFKEALGKIALGLTQIDDLKLFFLSFHSLYIGIPPDVIFGIVHKLSLDDLILPDFSQEVRCFSNAF